MTISTALLSQTDAAKDFEQNCRDLCRGLIETTRGNHNLTESQLTFKTVDGQKMAEESFQIASANGIAHGFVRCLISQGRIFNRIALAAGAPIEKQKEILAIAASIKFAEGCLPLPGISPRSLP